jgi:hypothetical protein
MKTKTETQEKKIFLKIADIILNNIDFLNTTDKFNNFNQEGHVIKLKWTKDIMAVYIRPLKDENKKNIMFTSGDYHRHLEKIEYIIALSDPSNSIRGNDGINQYFKLNQIKINRINTFIMILLHEIGHIYWDHTLYRDSPNLNTHISINRHMVDTIIDIYDFGDYSDEEGIKRVKMVSASETYADMFAILRYEKMISIINYNMYEKFSKLLDLFKDMC